MYVASSGVILQCHDAACRSESGEREIQPTDSLQRESRKKAKTMLQGIIGKGMTGVLDQAQRANHTGFAPSRITHIKHFYSQLHRLPSPTAYFCALLRNVPQSVTPIMEAVAGRRGAPNPQTYAWHTTTTTNTSTHLHLSPRRLRQVRINCR